MSESETQNRVSDNGARTLSRNDRVAILSELVSRIDFARQHGMQYGSDRDIYDVAGYPRNLSYSQFHALYERDGFAKKIIDMPAETTWRAPPEIVEPDMEEDGTDFTEAWADLAKRLRVWSRFERLDKLSRKGRYAVLLIGTPDGDDQNLVNEMGNLRGPEDVQYLDAYSEKYAKIHKLVDDPRNPRYRLPEIYNIDLGGDIRDGGVQTRSQTVKVHWSRVIHVAEDLLEDDIFGTETLRPLYNDFHDLQKIRASTPEAHFQRVAGILVGKVDPEAHTNDEILEDLSEELEEIYHDLRKIFLGQGVDLERLAGDEPNPKAAADLCITMIAAGSPIPKRMLIGSETGERASTEDQKSYYGAMAERQVQHAEPAILRPFIDRLIERRGLPRPGQAGYEVVWPTLFKEPEKDIAEANKARAETASALTPVGGDVLQLVEIDQDRNVWLVPRSVDDPSPFDALPDATEDPGPPEATDDQPDDGSGEDGTPESLAE